MVQSGSCVFIRWLLPIPCVHARRFHLLGYDHRWLAWWEKSLFAICHLQYLLTPWTQITPLKFIWASILSTFPIIPFSFHQYNGYQMFCLNTSTPRPWCSYRLPSIYTYVQSSYWNSGFMLYWSRQQSPNFIISTPVILLLLWGCLTVIPNVVPSVFLVRTSRIPFRRHTPFHSKSIIPHAIYALLYTLMLLFFAHTQIILRQACSIPFLYWSAAKLFSEKPTWSHIWVTWSIIWGLTSIVLWTVFLPPA